ncbi:MAG: hypothetical protein Kilf2KO_40130 [Rhodospirillales bacterium]
MALVVSGCARRAPLEPIDEASVAPELAPYLEGGLSRVTVDLNEASFAAAIDDTYVTFEGMLAPRVSFILDLQNRFERADPGPARIDLQPFVNKYPELFRFQDRTDGFSCTYSRLTEGQWVFFGGLVSIVNRGSLLSQETRCWFYVVPIDVGADETREIELVRGEQTVYWPEGGCGDRQ